MPPLPFFRTSLIVATTLQIDVTDLNPTYPGDCLGQLSPPMIPERKERSTMRRAFFGSLVCIALITGGSAFAEDAIPSSGAHMRDTSRQVAKPQKKPAASAPLSAAAAYEATRSDLTTAPLHARTPAPVAAEKPWTGVYVGVNAGAAK